MKTILIVLLFAGLVVQNKGFEEQHDEEDIRIHKRSQREASGEKRASSTLQYSYNDSRSLADQINASFGGFQGDAATRAMRLYQRLIGDWDNQTLTERQDRAKAVKTVADNIDGIRNSGQNPEASFLAVLNLMKALKELTSSNGHIISLPAMFTTSCMNLFGEAQSSYMYSLINGEIISMTTAHSTTSIGVNDIQATGNKYSQFKTLLNSLGRDDDKISASNANRIQSFIRQEYVAGFAVMTKLGSQISNMKTTNNAADAKKFLACLELYAKLETVRQMMLTHALSLIPENSTAISVTQRSLRMSRITSQSYMSTVYSQSLRSKFLPYYDDKVFRVTSAYMAVELGLSQKRDEYPGLSCIGIFVFEPWPGRGFYLSIWKWFKFPKISHPYFGVGGIPCKWRIVSHGQRLFSIVNKHGCPSGKWCNNILSFDSKPKPPPVTIERNDPMLWEIIPQGGALYKIRPKVFGDSKYHSCYLGYGPRTIGQTTKKYIGQLDCSTVSTKSWKIQRAPSSDMATENGSAATNHPSEDQEDDSVSDEEDNGVNNFSDENENGIQEKSKQETDEAKSNQDSDTENDIS